ncbi:MAG: radical SAM protein [Planctomycetes bacterium]|nr:radical SAM protein [Planctomycetota bacterium]
MESTIAPSIILIQLYGPMQPPDAEPLSIEVLAAATLDHCSEARIEILTLSTRDDAKSTQQIIDRIRDQMPNLIGISIPQSTLYLAFNLIRAITQLDTKSHIVIGHALPTHSPDIFLDDFPDLIIVRGWGEDSFVELVKHYTMNSPNLDDIPNLCYLQDAQLHMTPLQWSSKIFKPIRSKPALYFPRLEASRGCQHDICTFCTRAPRNNKHNLTWYRRPVDAVLQDIADIKAKGKKYFTFADEDFIGQDIKGAQKIAEGLLKVGELQFSLSIRADNVFNPLGTYAENEQRRRLFETLRKAGLYLVYIGVESLSDSQLKRYGKGITAEDSIRAVREIQRLGVGLEMGFILFDPLTNKSELIENIERLDQSGLWANVGQLFNCLRAQKDTPYMRLLIMSELIDQYHPNTMSYDYRYSDPLIGEIATFCRTWLGEFDPIYLLARNIERTSESSGVYAHFVFSTRSLLFRLLRKILNVQIIQNQRVDQEILSFFGIEREGLVRNLYRYLASKSELTETERTLKQECELFLAHRGYGSCTL